MKIKEVTLTYGSRRTAATEKSRKQKQQGPWWIRQRQQREWGVGNCLIDQTYKMTCMCRYSPHNRSKLILWRLLFNPQMQRQNWPFRHSALAYFWTVLHRELVCKVLVKASTGFRTEWSGGRSPMCCCVFTEGEQPWRVRSPKLICLSPLPPVGLWHCIFYFIFSSFLRHLTLKCLVFTSKQWILIELYPLC